MLNTLQSLGWAVRVFYLMVLFACIANTIMACRRKYQSHWRIEFGYTAVVTGIFLIYIYLRLSMVLDRADYARAIVWLYPCLAIPFLAVPLLFHWEDKFFRKAVQARIEEELERDGS